MQSRTAPLTALFLAMVVAPCVLAQTDHIDFNFGPRFWGGTVGVRYALEPPVEDRVETSITGLISSAWESRGYYRNPDGTLYVVPTGETSESGYNRFDLVWEAGLLQGIAPRSDATEDLAVAFLFYRGRLSLPQDNDSIYFDSGRPEIEGSLRGSIIGGVAYSKVTTDEVTRVRRGVRGELALEWGPPFLHNDVLAVADYTRTTLMGRGYLPLFIAPTAARVGLAGYLAAFGIVDWVTGPEIPLGIASSTGGRSIRSAPGGSVRGYRSGRFDSTFKAIANAELRLTMPIFSLPMLVPGLLVYTDGGYYVDARETSATSAENSGMLLTSGVGLSVEIGDIASLVFYTNYLWTDPSIEGERWIPFSLGFGFHY